MLTEHNTQTRQQVRKQAKNLSVMTGKRSTQQNERKDVKPLLLMYAEAIEKTQRDLDAARKDLKRDYKANQDIEVSESEEEGVAITNVSG